MSTINHPEAQIHPPLVDGQRLNQPTFHERYAAMPQGTWAELVGGIVRMPSPLRYEHGDVDHVLAFWVVQYRRFTPGPGSAANVTTKLGQTSEVQPDAQLRIREERGGQSRIVDGYVVGAPEMVVEIGRSSRSYDLGDKKADYEAAGVLEYLFVGIEPDEVRWFVRRDGRFVDLAPGEDGIFRSEVFPGLWLDPAALFAEDLNSLVAALERGLASPEHAAFVARMT